MAHNGDPQPRAPGDMRHEPGVRQGHPRAPAQRRQGHRQVPCRQARQRGRRQGREGGGPGERPAEKDEAPVAEERGEPDGTPAGDQTRPAAAAAQDRAGLPDARDPAGHLRRQRRPDRGRGGPQGPVLVYDAFTLGAHENTGPAAAPALGRHPRLLRPPAHERDPRRLEQRHPARQDPREGRPQHGLFQHDDLPDLRQTRPANRHHLTGSHPH